MSSSTKETILEVANKVIAEKGLTHFTLDEIARDAGISKGGLLHHYPSKDKLIKALIENYLDLFEAKISEREKNLSDTSCCNWLVSFINEQLSQSKIHGNNIQGLLAAVASNQELLNPVIEKRKEWLEKIYDSKDPIMAIIISFACDGVAYSNLLGLEVFPEDIKTKLMERLIQLAKEC